MPPPFQNVLIYEDELAQGRRFLPLTYTRSVAELRSGLFTGIERVIAALPRTQIYLHTRSELRAVVATRHQFPVNEVPKGPTLLLNARETFGFTSPSSHEVTSEFSANDAVAIRSGAAVSLGEPKSDAVGALWDIVHRNSAIIEQDFRLLSNKLRHARERDFRGVLIQGEVYVHLGATVGLGVVLDGSDGPIVIEEGAHVLPHATILGPAVIGRKSLVKVGAKIYQGTSIGPVCKVGGEIESSIFQGYSNKQHDGYVGHSYLGEWCNLGADTNTSDLKNDYSSVRVTIEGEEFNTGSMFVGLMMGDHSKSAINTQFNTGTAVGVSCNVFDAGFPPKWIPNFSWGGAAGFVSYKYEKALQVAKIVTSRRNFDLSNEEEQLLRHLFERQNHSTV